MLEPFIRGFVQALAQDQLRALRQMCEAAFGDQAPYVEVYDGDTIRVRCLFAEHVALALPLPMQSLHCPINCPSTCTIYAVFIELVPPCICVVSLRRVHKVSCSLSADCTLKTSFIAVTPNVPFKMHAERICIKQHSEKQLLHARRLYSQIKLYQGQPQHAI